MTVVELIEKLHDYPNYFEVCIFDNESFDAIPIEEIVITNSRVDGTGHEIVELR